MLKGLLSGRVTAAITLLLLLAASCQAPFEDPGSPSIRGLVNGFSESRGNAVIIGFVQVEGELEEDTLYDRALVTVTRKTALFRVEDGVKTKAALADLRPGLPVEVWFSGPAAESYPVQAEASMIIILGGPNTAPQ